MNLIEGEIHLWNIKYLNIKYLILVVEIYYKTIIFIHGSPYCLKYWLCLTIYLLIILINYMFNENIIINPVILKSWLSIENWNTFTWKYWDLALKIAMWNLLTSFYKCTKITFIHIFSYNKYKQIWKFTTLFIKRI